MLAVEYILMKQPEGIASLVLSGPLLSSPLWIADQKRWLLQSPQAIQDTIRKYEELRAFSSKAYQDAMTFYYKQHVCRLDPWPGCLNLTFEKLGKEVYSYMWGPSEFCCTGTLKNLDLSGRLNELTVPAMLTCGEFDEASPSTVSYFHKLIPGSKFIVFAGSSHSHHLERFESYIPMLRGFLKENDQRLMKNGN
jgi:proline iminopeptidase